MGRKSLWQFRCTYTHGGSSAPRKPHDMSDVLRTKRLVDQVLAPGRRAGRAGNGRSGSFESLFRAPVHWCTPRLEPPHEWFVADCCVRERSGDYRHFAIALAPWIFLATFNMRHRMAYRSGCTVGRRLIPQQAADLQSKKFLISRTGTGVRDAHGQQSTALLVPSRLFAIGATRLVSSIRLVSQHGRVG
jgi:hypothetical protein